MHTAESSVLDGRGRWSSSDNTALFFRRWLANPLQMVSIVPSSPALCWRVAAQARVAPGEVVVELGAGTGVISRALVASSKGARRGRR